MWSCLYWRLRCYEDIGSTIVMEPQIHLFPVEQYKKVRPYFKPAAYGHRLRRDRQHSAVHSVPAYDDFSWQSVDRT
jgi:hypothetical protein